MRTPKAQFLGRSQPTVLCMYISEMGDRGHTYVEWFTSDIKAERIILEGMFFIKESFNNYGILKNQLSRLASLKQIFNNKLSFHQIVTPFI